MTPEFWKQCWQSQEIRFHQSAVNANLIRFFPQLGVAKGATVFVPLCGKSLDMYGLNDKAIV